MDKEEREWVLENVETINADTNDIDELCCALEHSTIFAVENIQNFATKLIDLDFKNKDLQQRIDNAEEYLEKIKKRRKENLTITQYKAKWRTLFDYLESDEIINDVSKILKGDDINE